MQGTDDVLRCFERT